MQIHRGLKSSIEIIFVENFPRDNELPNLISIYEKPSNDDKTEHFFNEYAKCRLFELNQPIDSFVERQHLNDCLPIFPDTCGPSRMDTTIKLPVKDNSCHSTPNLLASSPDSGILQYLTLLFHFNQNHQS